jgi:hypothetical protein
MISAEVCHLLHLAVVWESTRGEIGRWAVGSLLFPALAYQLNVAPCGIE